MQQFEDDQPERVRVGFGTVVLLNLGVPGEHLEIGAVGVSTEEVVENRPPFGCSERSTGGVRVDRREIGVVAHRTAVIAPVMTEKYRI